MSTAIFTDRELARARAGWMAIGALLGAALVLAALEVAEAGRIAGTVIERQTGTETVARIPTRHHGRLRECVLQINHATKSWSLSC